MKYITIYTVSGKRVRYISEVILTPDPESGKTRCKRVERRLPDPR